MYHQLCVLGVPLGDERKVDRVPAKLFQLTQRQAGVTYCRVDVTDLIALRSVQCRR